jgi:hypothetical protein
LLFLHIRFTSAPAFCWTLDDYKAAADTDLQAAIQREQNALDLDSFVGLTMDEALSKVNQRIASVIFLPMVTR